MVLLTDTGKSCLTYEKYISWESQSWVRRGACYHTRECAEGSVFHFHRPCLREFNFHQICNSLVCWPFKCQLFSCVTLRIPWKSINICCFLNLLEAWNICTDFTNKWHISYSHLHSEIERSVIMYWIWILCTSDLVNLNIYIWWGDMYLSQSCYFV